MSKTSAFLKNFLFIIFLVAFSISLSLSEELYLFKEEASLLITNTPAPGYIKRVGKPQRKFGRRTLPSSFQHLDSFIENIAKQYSVSPSLIKAVIQVESDFNPSAVSPKGAKGLMQLLDSTASDFGVDNIFDPYENIKGGTKYLRYLLDIFEEDLSLTLAAYNAGSETVLRYKGIPPYPETINYVKNVLKLLEAPNKIKTGTVISPKVSEITMKKDRNGQILIVN